MKPCLALLLGLFIILNSFSQDILITGVGHGFAGNHGFIELYVKNDIEFEQFYLRSYRPGVPELIATLVLPSPLSADTVIYVSSDDGFEFVPFFGFGPNYGAESVGNIDGNDTVTIEDINGTVIDIYGAKGVNGFGEPWNYNDGWAYRKPGFGPNATFTLSEWDIMVSAFSSCSGTNASCTDPYPNGTYTLSNDRKDIPEFSLYPNPTKTGFVNIVHRESTTPRVKLYTVSGQLVLDEKVEQHSLDVSQLAPGMYFLRMNQDQSVLSKRLIVH